MTLQVPSFSKHTEREQISQMSGAEVISGEFYTSILPGGFQDSLSGIKIPGPKAMVDSVTRKITALVEIPEPVQLPTDRWCSLAALPENERFRLMRDKPEGSDRPQQILVPFATNTLDEYVAGLTLAIRCGAIQHVSEDEMKTTWPEAWERRKERIVHSELEASSDFAALIDRAMQSRRVRLHAGTDE